MLGFEASVAYGGGGGGSGPASCATRGMRLPAGPLGLLVGEVLVCRVRVRARVRVRVRVSSPEPEPEAEA